MRVKIKSFCQLKINSKKNLNKLIIIDEAESLTEVAQQALRRIIEKNSQAVRFIFICNYPSKIIEAIQSRCAVLRFKTITESILLKNIIKILHAENILFSVKGLETLIFLAEGDMRRLVNESEVISKSFFKITNKTIKTSSFVPRIFVMITEFLAFTLNTNYLGAFELFIDICNEGHEATEVVYEVFKFLKKVRLFNFEKIKVLKNLCKFQVLYFQRQLKINNTMAILKRLIQIKKGASEN